MNLTANKLKSHLDSNLSQVYVISGDEYLLVQNASDLIKNKALQNGFTERQILEVNRTFNWQNLTNSLAQKSLFSTKKIIELRIPTNKIGNEGSQIIIESLNKISAQCRKFAHV